MTISTVHTDTVVTAVSCIDGIRRPREGYKVFVDCREGQGSEQAVIGKLARVDRRGWIVASQRRSWPKLSRF